VVLENIFRFIEEKGIPPFQAAIEGTKEIGLAVTATTLSLLAVFLPVGFMGGIVGRFMSSFGFTSSFAIAVSLLVSFTLTPTLAARLIKRSDDAIEGPVDRALEPVDHGSKQSRFYRPIDRAYTRMLEWSMTYRWVIVVACVLVIFSILPLFKYVGKNFLPVDDQSQFEVNVALPKATRLRLLLHERAHRRGSEETPGRDGYANNHRCRTAATGKPGQHLCQTYSD